MTSGQAPKPPVDSGETSETVQLLVGDAGNRSAISGMLDAQFQVDTSQTVTDADLYLVEDKLFPEYEDALRQRIEQAHPVFCPVVIIRHEGTNLQQGGVDSGNPDKPARFDDVVDAPINPQKLLRRLNSLLVRRQQSEELKQQVSTLEEREQRLRLFEQGVESTSSGIAMTDPSGTIEYVNPALESITGYTEDEVRGESPQILLPEGTGEVFDEEFWRTIADQREWEGDIIIEGKDSPRQIVNARTTALRDAEDETEGYVIVLSDITERIQREQELEDREEELDLLRQILTRYLRHNLRNDLNLIQGNAQMLVEDETLSPKQTEVAKTIIEISEDLQEMSDSARTYSSLLERDDTLSAFDLSEITTTAVQTVREDYADVKFEIDVPETCEFQAREGIQRAFEELIDNAAQYNDSTDPWVRIQVRDCDGARLVIEDNGPGIPDQERESLEEGGETQLTHSQGIGLWLSKLLIEGIDGSLSINATDAGTRVTVDLPPPDDVGTGAPEFTTLKEREQRLQTITDRMTDAILQVDEEWNISSLDGRGERILEVNTDAIVGQSLWEVLSDLQDTQFETVVRNAMKSRSSTSVEQYCARIDAWLEFNVYPEFDGGLSFYTREITERKSRERELGEEKEKYSTLVERSHDGIMVIRDEEIQFANERAADILRYDHSELLGKSIIDIVAPQDQDRIRDRYHRRLDPEKESPPSRYDAVFITKDGEHRTVNVSAAPIQFEGDAADLLAIRDITEQKERETRLQETAARLEALFEHSPDMIDVLDPKGTILEANSRLCDELGYHEDELRGTPIWELDQLVEADDVKTLLSDFDPGERRKFEGRYERRDGSTVPVEVHLLRLDLDGEDRFLAVSRDISERKEGEQEVERAETVFQNTQDALFLIDVDEDHEFRVQRVNQAYEDITGFTSAEITGKTPREIVGGEVGAEIESRYSECLEQRETIQYVEEVPVDGETISSETKLTPVIDNDRVSHLIGATRDITERKDRERELAEKTRQLEAIVQNTEEAIYIKDIAGYYQFINESGAGLFDMSAEEVIGKHDKDLFDEESVPDIRSEDEKVMESGEPVRKETVRYIDGEKHVFLDAKYPYRDEDGEVIGLIGISPDITERKEQEWKLQRQNERLDEFANVVSHDLRNPLNVALGHIELAREVYSGEHLKEAEGAIERSLTLIDDMLALAKAGQQTGDLEPVDISSLAHSCWEHVETREATILTDLDRRIRADKSRLQQLFENLFRNAVENGSGTVTIRVGALSNGFYVEDDGPGIPEAKREEVFEPGFSTREEGTGVGLSIVQQIVEAHGWDIRVTESTDCGARFEITGVEFTAE
jgi:PAS domain S-box-containing protein